MRSRAGFDRALVPLVAVTAAALLMLVMLARPLAQSPPSLLTGTGLIFGRVVDGSTGRPIAGARVALYGSADRVLTDADGRFAFFDLPAGEYRVAVAKPGYARGEFGQHWTGANLPVARPGFNPPLGRLLTLEAGERIGDALVRLWKHGSINGRVVDENGAAIVGVQVQAWPRVFRAGRSWFNHVLPAIGRTDDRGIYRIAGLVPGDYVILAPSVSVTTPMSLQPPGRAYENAWSPDLLRIQRLFQSSFPAPDAGHAVTDGDWLHSVFGQAVPPPAAGSEARQVYPRVFHPGVHSSAEAVVTRVDAGADVNGVDFRLQPVRAFSVSGVVHGPDGPAGGMALRLRPLTAGSPTGDAESALAVSDARGSFTFLSVAPGQYHLHALETPHTGRPQFFTPSDVSDGIGLIEFRGDPWSEESTWWAATDLAVGNADVHDVSVVLRRGSRLSGTLRFDGREASPSSQAQSGIVIQVDRADGQLRGTRMSNEVAISPSGEFRSVELPPGRYFLRVSGEPAGWAFHSAVWQGRDVSVVPVEIGTSGTNGIAVTFTDRPSSLSGTIRTSRGSPDLNASVAVFPIDVEAWVDYGESPRNIVTLRSDADGSYRIPNLPPGEYFAVAVADEVLAGWHDADLFARLARMAERVRVVEGEARRRDLTTVVP